MKSSKQHLILLITLFAIASTLSLTHAAVRLKSIAHLSGLQENPVTGFGLVVGLAGSGDSRRNKETTQAIANLLQTFGINITPQEVNSRNTATVIVTTHLPSYVHQGDKIDVNVASLGDAKSLQGGTLLITPLKGPDNQIYALAQGPISISGYKYDLFGNMMQKNHPTAGLIPSGAIVEKTLYNELRSKEGELHLILNRPDFTTAHQVELMINKHFTENIANARSAQIIEIHPPASTRKHFIYFISQLENLNITPDNVPIVVINERTGVIIAGADVKIDAVTISHGNLQIAIATDYQVSQPTLLSQGGQQIHTAMTPATNIKVKENQAQVIQLPAGATIADFLKALTKVQTTSRDIIAILESLQRAGALHAELIIQ